MLYSLLPQVMNFWGLSLAAGGEYEMRRAEPVAFAKALSWEPCRINVCPFSDFFCEEADDWRAEAWEIIKKTPRNRWVIVTEYPERIKDALPEDWLDGYPQVMIGAKVMTQEELHNAVIGLLSFPARRRAIFATPMLEALNFESYLFVDPGDGGEAIKPFSQIVISGDRGNKADMEKYCACAAGWIDSVIKQCHAADTPVYVESIGRQISILFGRLEDPRGDDYDTFPGHLKVRIESKWLVPGDISEDILPDKKPDEVMAPVKQSKDDDLPMGDLDTEYIAPAVPEKPIQVKKEVPVSADIEKPEEKVSLPEQGPTRKIHPSKQHKHFKHNPQKN